jgi:hypothetical protein
MNEGDKIAIRLCAFVLGSSLCLLGIFNLQQTRSDYQQQQMYIQR